MEMSFQEKAKFVDTLKPVLSQFDDIVKRAKGTESGGKQTWTQVPPSQSALTVFVYQNQKL